MRLTRKQACSVLRIEEIQSYDPSIVKKAYLQQAKKWHPDKCKDSDAKVRFQEVSAAYECLLREEDDEEEPYVTEYYDEDGLDDFIAQEFFRFMYSRMYGHPGVFGSEPTRKEQREWFRKKKADAARKAKKEAQQNRQYAANKKAAKSAQEKHASPFKDELGESLKKKVAEAQPGRPAMISRTETSLTLNIGKKGLIGTDVLSKERPINYQLQFRPSSGAHLWDVIDTRDSQAFAEGLVPGTKYDFSVRQGIKYGGSMMWTQWSVVSSYPTAGNPPPVTQSTKEVTPQNVNKKKKDEVTKAKKKEKQQHVEVKFIDPEEIAAKQQYEREKQRAIEEAMEKAARDYAEESEKLAEKLANHSLNSTKQAPKPNAKSLPARPKSSRRRQKDDNSEDFWQREDEANQKIAPGDRPAIDDPTIKKVNFGAASRFDPRSQNNDWNPDGQRVSAMEQAQIEEAIQLSLALENSLSQTEIEAQKRALAAFEAQNAFSDSFGGVEPKSQNSPQTQDESVWGPPNSHEGYQSQSQGRGASHHDWPSSNKEFEVEPYEPYVEPEDNVPMPTWDVPNHSSRQSLSGGWDSTRRRNEGSSVGWGPTPNNVNSSKSESDQGWESKPRISNQIKDDPWANTQTESDSKGWNQWGESGNLGQPSIWGTNPGQNKVTHQANSNLNSNFSGNNPQRIQANQNPEAKSLEQVWKNEWNSPVENQEPNQSQNGWGLDKNAYQTVAYDDKSGGWEVSENPKEEVYQQNQVQIQGFDNKNNSGGWSTIPQKSKPEWGQGETNGWGESLSEKSEVQEEGGWNPAPNIFIQENRPITMRNDPSVAEVNWNTPIPGPAYSSINQSQNKLAQNNVTSNSIRATFNQYQKPGEASSQNQASSGWNTQTKQSFGASNPQNFNANQGGLSHQGVRNGYANNVNQGGAYNREYTQPNADLRPPSSQQGWASASQDDSDDDYTWGKPQPRQGTLPYLNNPSQPPNANPYHSHKAQEAQNGPYSTGYDGQTQNLGQTKSRYVVPGKRDEDDATFEDLFQDLFPK